MTTKQKPVWRMNTGNGVPSDYAGGKIFHSFSGLMKGGQAFFYHSYLRDIDMDGRDVIAYQTNRTKAAKYERVDCDCDEGTIHLKGGYHTKCGLCNGKGYTLEAIK